MDWKEYLSNTRFEIDTESEEYRRFQKYFDQLQIIYDLHRDDLRYKNIAKIIIKEKTKVFPGSENYPDFSFRFQCCITGRTSRLIKMEDYSAFGISRNDCKTGGDFPVRQDIPDKFKDAQLFLQKKVSNLFKEMQNNNHGKTWIEKYSEYLSSEEWYERRKFILIRDNFKCVIDSSQVDLQVHHVTYENVGQENNADLVTLCKKCHKIIHDYAHPDASKYRGVVDRYVVNLLNSGEIKLPCN